MINSFSGVHRFLSNFWPAVVSYQGVDYPTVEHAYQACKTLDPQVRHKIQMAKKPGQAKRLGNTVQLREDWEEVKVEIMSQLVAQKFIRHPDLARKLLKTGDQKLVEGNYWHDCFWGVCSCERCGGNGKNMLGVILMEVRARLRTDQW